MSVGYEVDQAEGLRRMLERPRPGLFTFLSVLPESEKQAMLFNLGASLRGAGSQVLLLNTVAGANDRYARLLHPDMATLLDVARGEGSIDSAVQALPQGMGLALLSRHSEPGAVRKYATQIAAAFDRLTAQADMVLLSGALDAEEAFPIAAMEAGEIVIQVSAAPASIKAAYLLLKRLSDKLGRRRFGLLVTGSPEKEAHTVYDNIAQAASRYMATQLDFFGSVPADEHLVRATGQGRTVIDAFPLASASQAFNRIAGQFLTPDGAYGMSSGSAHLGV
jgi:flagellar biosynthesis protein FlhG